jgi:hypothetical protein
MTTPSLQSKRLVVRQSSVSIAHKAVKKLSDDGCVVGGTPRHLRADNALQRRQIG